MSNTFTRTETNTYTDARAYYVMGKVYENLIGLMSRGLITKTRVDNIRSDILYLLSKGALDFFELQFCKSNGSKLGGIHYKAISNGYIYSDEESGGFDFWSLPNETRVILFVNLDYNSKYIQEVEKQLEKWGWGTGKRLEGDTTYLKSYSKDGYGFKENKVGIW
jgi:hypothetical protein